MTKHNIDWTMSQYEAARIDALIRVAELCGESWARAGHDVHALIREHSRHWPGGRTGKVRLTLAVLAGAQRARRAEL
jgi:hypothetical protein